MSLAEIEREALRLTERERATLAEHLLSSLGADTMEMNESLWTEEAERRYQAYKSGQLPARLADAVFRDAHRAL